LCTIWRICNRCTGFVAITTFSECLYLFYGWLVLLTDCVPVTEQYDLVPVNGGDSLRLGR